MQGFFSRLGKELGDKPMAQLWQEGLTLLPLEEHTRQNLLQLGPVLGRYDVQSQSAAIALARTHLEQLLEEKRRENTRQARLLPGLGACFGAMLAVILM